MKAAALAAVALILCVALPGPIQAKEKPTFCIGKDGKNYAVGDSYVDNEGEACIRYKCAKRKGKFIMKKEKCDCNGGNHGISCCPNYVRGDMVGGSEIKITFSPNTENGCQNSCKVQHPTSIGVTQDHDGTSSCYCEFGSPIVGGSANVYKTCLFSSATPGILKTIKRTKAETTTTSTAPTTTKAATKPTIVSSMNYAHAYRGSLLLENACEGKNPSNYWLTPNGKTGEEAYIIINLGRVTQFNRFKIKNTHNGNSNDRGAKNVGLFTSNSKDGPWNLVADKLMTDARNKGCNVPLEEVVIATTEAQFIKLVINSYYGHGGGLKYLGVDLVPDSIYFIAGGYGTLRDIELYHPTMANLSCSMSPPPLNKDWYLHTTFYYNNTIHLYGGNYRTASTCVSYNVNTEEWKTHTLTTSRNYGHSSVVLKKRVFIIGGQDTRDNYYGAESTPLPLIDQPVLTPVLNLDYKGYAQCTTKVDEDTLLVTGGYYNEYLSSVIEYNAKTRTTTSLPSMKQPRFAHGCAVVEMDNTKRIIVAGGSNSADGSLETTEMLQMGGSYWEPLGNLNVARLGHSIAVTQRGVMAMGGYSGGYLSSVELLDWSAMSWRIVQPSLGKSRGYFGGAVEIPASMFRCQAAGDGEWSAWSKFTACSATCGNTTKTRTRTCSNPSPGNGGKPCPGLDEEVVSCGLSPCGFNMSATCDDVMWLFADGDLLVNNSSDWRVTSEVHIPACTKVIEIHCLDSWIHGGILASSDNGLITDGAWNCSSDNRTTWNPAYLLGRNGRTAPDISPEAIWIWTDMSHWMQTDHRRHTKAICKIELETSQCPERHLCPPFGELTPTTISTPTPTPAPTATSTIPKPGFNLTATCDNEMKLFVDGNLLATSSNWRDTSRVNIPASTEAIEIHCMDTGTVGGILASSDNGLLTNGSWNCSSDNGTTWNPAYEAGPNSGAVPDISPESEWIWTGCIGDWTSKYTGKKYQKNIICKIDLKPVIDGGWSEWSPFSPCSATCGDATKARTRTCSNPPPNNGGDPCFGLEEEVVSCGVDPCGGDSCPYTDKYMDCPKWKSHCESGQWKQCVKENCPKTCKCAGGEWKLGMNINPCDGANFGYGGPWAPANDVGSLNESLTKDFVDSSVWKTAASFVTIARHVDGQCTMSKTWELTDKTKSMYDYFSTYPGRIYATGDGSVNDNHISSDIPEAAEGLEGTWRDPIFGADGGLVFNWYYSNNGARIAVPGGYKIPYTLPSVNNNGEDLHGLGNENAGDTINGNGGGEWCDVAMIGPDCHGRSALTCKVVGTDRLDYSKHDGPCWGSYAIFVSQNAQAFSCQGRDLSQIMNVDTTSITTTVLVIGPVPWITMSLEDFSVINSNTSIPDPGLDFYLHHNGAYSVCKVINGIMYLCNTYIGSKWCISYNGSGLQWQLEKEMNLEVARSHPADTLSPGDQPRWIVQGGMDNFYLGRKYRGIVEVWTPESGKWRIDSNYTSPQPNDIGCILVIEGKILQVGGRIVNPLTGGALYTNRVFLGDMEVASMKEPRIYIDCAIFENRVWVAGGATSHHGALSHTVEIYDYKNDTWTSGPSFPPNDDGSKYFYGKLKLIKGDLYFICVECRKIFKLINTEDVYAWEAVADIPKNSGHIAEIMEIDH